MKTASLALEKFALILVCCIAPPLGSKWIVRQLRSGGPAFGFYTSELASTTSFVHRAAVFCFMYSPIRAIACLASGSSSAKIGNMWIISSHSSIETSQPAALARSAHRVESSRSVSQVPTRISVGGSPRRSAYSGDASGALRSPSSPTYQ
jgi:hypothetical protein